MLYLAMILSIMFKPYVMLPLLIATLVFYGVRNRTERKAGLKYVIVTIIIFLAANFSLQIMFGKDVVKILGDRQRDFMDMSNGGLFLLGKDKFIRLAYDYNLVKVDSSGTEIKAKIKSGPPYIYWEHSHQQDTLYCKANTDTITEYQLLYIIPKANSTLIPPVLIRDWPSFLKSVPYALYICTLKPLFVDARNALDIITSFENLIILIALLFFLYNGIKTDFKKPHYVYFLSLVIIVLILIGSTSPNLGAIQRYRAPVMPFILLTALLSSTINDPQKLCNFFKNKA